MIQDILAEPEWHDVLTAEDRRGLTALFWAHVRPYGDIKLNMTLMEVRLSSAVHRMPARGAGILVG